MFNTTALENLFLTVLISLSSIGNIVLEEIWQICDKDEQTGCFSLSYFWSLCQKTKMSFLRQGLRQVVKQSLLASLKSMIRTGKINIRSFYQINIALFQCKNIKFSSKILDSWQRRKFERQMNISRLGELRPSWVLELIVGVKWNGQP